MTTRDEYVAAADRVCRTAEREALPHFRRANDLFDRERERAGANQFIAAFRVLYGYVADLREIPPPPGDERAVTKWLDGEAKSLELRIKSWTLFKRGAPDRVVNAPWRRAQRIHREAHEAVKALDFKSCT